MMFLQAGKGGAEPGSIVTCYFKGIWQKKIHHIIVNGFVAATCAWISAIAIQINGAVAENSATPLPLRDTVGII